MLYDRKIQSAISNTPRQSNRISFLSLGVLRVAVTPVVSPPTTYDWMTNSFLLFGCVCHPVVGGEKRDLSAAHSSEVLKRKYAADRE